ncbi:hypothetical protein SAMN05216275_1748 [Streptosporangium canum]|uniref:Uncharacterized protein n=1 Tax=Streptosporangium canum TaxID=324952 RepID=A0A1I4FWW6_9ACTN|nr:hypothetical protein SAMN05216275_1748 [Streptosporangium canum]
MSSRRIRRADRKLCDHLLSRNRFIHPMAGRRSATTGQREPRSGQAETAAVLSSERLCSCHHVRPGAPCLAWTRRRVTGEDDLPWTEKLSCTPHGPDRIPVGAVRRSPTAWVRKVVATPDPKGCRRPRRSPWRGDWGAASGWAPARYWVRTWSSTARLTTSWPSLASIDGLDRVRSVCGEMASAAAGRASPACLSTSNADSTNVAPADGLITTIHTGRNQVHRHASPGGCARRGRGLGGNRRKGNGNAGRSLGEGPFGANLGRAPDLCIRWKFRRYHWTPFITGVLRRARCRSGGSDPLFVDDRW